MFLTSSGVRELHVDLGIPQSTAIAKGVVRSPEHPRRALTTNLNYWRFERISIPKYKCLMQG